MYSYNIECGPATIVHIDETIVHIDEKEYCFYLNFDSMSEANGFVSGYHMRKLTENCPEYLKSAHKNYGKET